MIEASIDDKLYHKVPNLAIGLISYYHIAVGPSPQMIEGRFRFFQEVLSMELQEKELTDYDGIRAWREQFKQLGISPSRYRPSHEALFRRIKKGSFLESSHSAIDVNNLFSLEYQIPVGLYDTAQLDGPITLRLGNEQETYEGLNGREFSAHGKLVSVDNLGPFGSPIVDSTRTAVMKETTEATQIFYLNPSLGHQNATELLERASQMFTQVHGGEAEAKIITSTPNKV